MFWVTCVSVRVQHRPWHIVKPVYYSKNTLFTSKKTEVVTSGLVVKVEREREYKSITKFLIVLGDINDAMRKSVTPNN